MHPIMFELLARMPRWNRWTPVLRSVPFVSHSDDDSGNPARMLMERAESRAGLNPRQARELRSAAMAYLSVSR